MQKRLTELWSQAHPVEAYTAGLGVEPEVAGPPDELDRRDLERQILDEVARCPEGEELTRTVLRSLAVEVRLELPQAPLVEAVDWLRATIYRGVGDVEATEIEQALTRRLKALGRRIRETSPLAKILCRTCLEALIELSASSRSSGLGAAAQDLLPVTGDVSGSGSLTEILKAIAGGQDGGVLSSEEHRSVVADVYGFQESVGEIEAQAMQWLADELDRFRPLARAVGGRLDLGAAANPEAVIREMSRRRTKASSSVLQEALRQTRVALPLFRETLVDLTDEEASVIPEPTPKALEPLVTEGQEYMVDALTPGPRAHCFITEGECESVYTLANVLYHELAHCWNMLGAARADPGLPVPVRAGGATGSILLEGIALHREWEVFELYREAVAGAATSGYAELFDGVGASREEALEEFELETRYWRLARFLRALFDVRVHGGKQAYAEFLAEQAAATGFERERVHGFCFHFMGKPGCAPCYAVGGMKVAALQREAEAGGWTRRDFNTRMNRIGLLPPAFWRDHLELGRIHGATPHAGGPRSSRRRGRS